jgi:hypothetical protein
MHLLQLYLLAACQRNAPEPAQPDYDDWYALTAPQARGIKGVYGDVDDTLLTTTGPRIYQAKDKGKTWTKANYNENVWLFSITARKDTLLAFSAQVNNVVTKSFASNPPFFSVNQGISWERYR